MIISNVSFIEETLTVQTEEIFTPQQVLCPVL